MAISRLTGQDAKAQSTTTSVTSTYPGATTAGNLLIASLYTVGTHSSNTAPSGWTEQSFQNLSSTAQNIALYCKLATGSETTVTAANSASNQMRLHIYEYTGNANPLVVDTFNGANSGTTSITSISAGSVATTNANDLLFIMTGTAGNTTSQAYDSGFNILQKDASAIRLFDADMIVAATGTYSSTASWVTSVRGAAIIAAFQAAGGSTTGQIKAYNGSSFVAKPMKVWNGSAWVVKPVKRWDGSSWVTTPY